MIALCAACATASTSLPSTRWHGILNARARSMMSPTVTVAAGENSANWLFSHTNTIGSFHSVVMLSVSMNTPW